MTRTKHNPAKQHSDGSFDAVFLGSKVTDVKPVVDPAKVNIKSFTENPVLLYRHFGEPIGCVTMIGYKDGKLKGRIKFDSDDDFAQHVKRKWKKGLLRACSLGVLYDKNEWRLREVSVVFMPHDPTAVREEMDALAMLKEPKQNDEVNDENGVTLEYRLPPETLEDEVEKDMKPDETKQDEKLEEKEEKLEQKEEKNEVKEKDVKLEEKEREEKFEATKKKYAELLPKNFTGTSIREVLAEATNLHADDLHEKYLEGVADHLLEKREAAAKQTLEKKSDPELGFEKEYSFEEIREMERLNSKKN